MEWPAAEREAEDYDKCRLPARARIRTKGTRMSAYEIRQSAATPPPRTELDRWKPITESDDALRAALEDANIPALMTALVHLTGDVSILRGDIKPDASNFVDLQCGIPIDQQAKGRELAFAAIKAYRDRGCT